MEGVKRATTSSQISKGVFELKYHDFTFYLTLKLIDKLLPTPQESVRRLFQQQANVSDEFARWCEQALRSMKVAQDGLDSKTLAFPVN